MEFSTALTTLRTLSCEKRLFLDGVDIGSRPRLLTLFNRHARIARGREIPEFSPSLGIGGSFVEGYLPISSGGAGGDKGSEMDEASLIWPNQ